MKVVHVCSYFQHEVGYQEPALAAAHARLGHDVTVLTADRYYPFPHYESTYQPILGKRVFRKAIPEADRKAPYRVVRLAPLIEHRGSATPLFWNLQAKLKELAPDVVIAHELTKPITYGACQYKKQNSRVHLVADSHAAAYNTNWNSSAKKLYFAMWRKTIAPKIVRYADAILATGEDEQNYAREVLFSGIHCTIGLAPLAADTVQFAPNPETRARIRNALGIRNEEVVVVYAGKWAADKRTDLLISTVIKLKKRFAELRLLLLGQGAPDFVRALKELALTSERTVEFVSTVPNQELPAYLSAGDIGAWPGSKSNAMLEGLATGLPLILEDRAYARAYIAQQNGFSVGAENPAADLEQALTQLLSRPELRSEMAERSRSLALSHFSWEAIAKAFLP